MSEYINFKKAKIHFTDEGTGGAVVLLHGFLENLSMWYTLKPHLLKKNRVIAIDLLGHGKSESLGYVHTMETMAEAVYAVLKHLRLRRVVLIGHSMGGYVSLALAEIRPRMIKGLCLMNSTTHADTEEKIKNRNRALEAVKQNHKTFIRLALPNLFAEHNRLVFSKTIKHLINDAMSMSPQGILAAIEGMKLRKDRTAVFRNLIAEKLIIVGKQDPVLDYKVIKKIAENTKSDLIQFPDGHMSHIENDKEFTYNIVHFIEK